MKALGLRTVVYKVSDLGKAKKWYADVFQTQPNFNEPFYVGFTIGGYELGLLPEEETSNTKSDSTITYWGVNNIEQAFQDCLSKGAVAHEQPQNVGGELMVASVVDPWGNCIGLIYNPYFKLP